MKQQLHKAFSLRLMLLLSILVGGVSMAWADEVYYTLAPARGTNNSYTGNCDVTIDKVTWNLTGNSQQQPWRLGGKNIQNTDRTVYSKTAMGSAITKVDLTVGSESSITVNSLKLTVASDANFSNVIDEVSATFKASSTITFAPTSGTEWATGAYYKFTFNLTVSGSSNKFVEFTKAVFYAPDSGDTRDDADLSFAETSYTATIGSDFTAPTLNNPNGLTVTYSSSDTNVATVNASTGAVTLAAAGTTTITASFAVDEDYKEGSASYTLVVKNAGVAGTTTDDLTLSTTGVSGTSYSDWSGKTVTSSAVYAGQSVGGNNAIQLRSNNNNSGIITTTSGGKLVSVEVEWNSNSSEGRTINIYGSNTAYSAASDLYNETKQGTLLGTIVKGTSTFLDVTGDYEYVGIRSASGALYLDKVSITWASGKANAGLAFSSETATATLGETFTAPTLSNPNSLAITYNSSNTDVATVDASTGAVTLKAAGTTTITATSEATDAYKAGSASYTLTVSAANQVATPVITLGATTFFTSTTATITCETEGATILYSTDNGTTWQTYAEALTLTETTTLVAKATKAGATESLVSEAVTATKNTVLEGLSAVVSGATSTSQTSYVHLTNAQITKRAQSGNSGEMQDANAGVLLYNSSFKEGKVYNGIFNVTYVLYNGNTEVTAITAISGEGTITDAESEVEPITITLAALTENYSTYLHRKVKVESATVTSALSSRSATIEQNGTNMDLRENNSTSVITKLTADANVTVIGYPALYNSTKQINIYSDDDITVNGEVELEENGLEYSEESVTLTVGDDFTAPTLTNPNDLPVTYESSNTALATVTEAGVVSLMADATGTATITATFAGDETYKAGSVSYTITVKAAPVVLNGNAFVKVTSTEDLTKGEYLIVYEEGEVAFNGGLDKLDVASNNISVTITDGAIERNETTEAAYFAWDPTAGTLKSASGYYIGKTANSNGMDANTSTQYTNTITIDDDGNAVITASGGCTLRYNKAPDNLRFRYYKNGQQPVALYKLTNVTQKTNVVTITDLSPLTMNVGDMDDFVLTYTPADASLVAGDDYEITYSSSDTSILDIDGTTYSAEAAGTVTVTVHVEALDEETYKNVDRTFEVTVVDSREAVVLTFTGLPSTIDLNETATYTATATPAVTGITYSSSNEDIVFVDASTGEIGALAVGSATITATFAGDATYKPATASYTITVVNPSAPKTYRALVAEKDGKYYAINNSFSNSSFGATVVDAVNKKVVTPQTDAISWELDSYGNGYGLKNKENNKYIGGTSSDAKLSNPETIVQWLIDDEGGIYMGTRYLLYAGSSNYFRNYASSNISGSNYSGKTKAYTFADGYTRTVTSGNWGTICLPSTVEAADVVGATFYSIAGKVMNGDVVTSIVLEEETDGLLGGVPYIFNATSTKIVAAYGDDTNAADTNNGLIGSLTGTDVATGMYLLSGGQIVKCGTDCSIGANRAYIDMSQVPTYTGSGEGLVKINIGGADGINGLAAGQGGATVYDLAGRRVHAAQKGLYIVNGKKVAVK